MEDQRQLKMEETFLSKSFHSFLSMPEEGYIPHYDDPRVGFFITQVNDMTSEKNNELQRSSASMEIN